MLTVTFHALSEVKDDLIRFAVIAIRYRDKWVLCRHKQRSTWEIPGGHREAGESIDQTARRELWEETGATSADIKPVCVYNVVKDDSFSYGMLFFAEVSLLGALPAESEIAETVLFDDLPDNLTYPAIQPHLHQYVLQWQAKTAS